MATSFVFEPPSDEELEFARQVDRDKGVEGQNHPVLSPWDFSSYSEHNADENAVRNVTSVDYKISKALQESSTIPPKSRDDDDDTFHEEHGRQEDFKEEEVQDETINSEETTSFFAPVEGASFQANSFLELHLSRPLLRACEALGYSKPTPIQAACIPLALTGRDICGSAITGSGKTAAFALPTLERLLFRPKRVPATRVLILTPTRELAVQVHCMIEKLAQFTDIRCCLIVGGLSLKVQESALRSMPDIVVASPGRMIDHLRNSISVTLDDLAVLILDEADRLLGLGFRDETHELVGLCPKRRQTLLFSATMTEEVDELVKLSLTKPLRLSADHSSRCPKSLIEEVLRIRRSLEPNQEAVLLSLCSKTFTSKVIIFSGTKVAAHRLKILFGLSGFKAAELHGNLTQLQRLDALELFRKQEADFLIATDVAARGLDIIGVQTVINYSCPRDLTSYVHRVGRTARAGREGHAVTFVTDNDRVLLKTIAKKSGSQLRSRIVSEKSICKWVKLIEQMECQVASVLQEEREEGALRRAEMEARKAENMIEHKDEIYSRPKRTWFVTEKEKKMVANEAKESIKNEKDPENGMISAKSAKEIKLKEKLKREYEKNLPRRKRRRLQAAREMLEEEGGTENLQGGMRSARKNQKPDGLTLVEVGYRQAKAAKALRKATDNRKFVRTHEKKLGHRKTKLSRKQENKELFHDDLNEMKQKKNLRALGKKISKSSFKSKSRYKRR